MRRSRAERLVNVLAILTKLGDKTAFIGKVGDDFFGKQLKVRWKRLASTLQAFVWIKIPATLALVHTFADGDRDFLSTVIRVQT